MKLPKLKSSKHERKQYNDEGFFESLEGIAKATVQSAKSDLLIDGAHDAWNELLTPSSGKKKDHGDSHDSHGSSNGGDLTAGHEIDLSEAHDNKEHAHSLTETAHEYIREIVHAGEERPGQENREIQVKVQEILIELKQLASSSQELKDQVEIISVEQGMEAPGAYHVNFLEKVVEWIRDARADVEDSLAWFNALRSKKAARQYGTMAKKHGTSFTLSNERNVATQVG